MNATSLGKIFPFGRAVAAAILLLTQTGQAATASFSSTAPTLGPNDIGNLTGANVDANNVSSGSDNATYLAHDRPIQGQTFTTGSNPAGYQLTAVTLRQVTYTTFALVPNLTYTIRIIVPVNQPPNRLSEIASETAVVPENTPNNIPSIAGGCCEGLGSGRYVTFTFATPIALTPNTVYGFDLGGGSGEHYWETDGTSSNPYAGGTAYSSGSGGVGSITRTTQTGDRVFAVRLTPAGLPIVSQPILSPTNAVYAGTPVSLRVSAAGSPPLGYRWRVNNGSGATFIPGATSTNLNVNTTLLLGAYDYDVVVTNSSGTVTSAPVTLTVFNASAPVVTMDTTPSSATRYVGQSVTFSAAFDGTQPISYHWHSLSGGPIPGATNPSVTLTNLQLSNFDDYYLVASNAIGETLSSFAVLIIFEPPPAPAPGTFAYAVLTNGPLAYWRLNDAQGSSVIYDWAGSYNAQNVGVNLGVPGLQSPAYPGFPSDNTAGLFAGGSAATSGASLMNGLTKFTLLGWFNSAGGNGSDSGLFGQNDALELGFSDTAGLTMWIQLNGSWDPFGTGPAGFTMGQWYFLAIVADGTNAYIYVNGVRRAQQPGPGGAPSASSSFGFNIGGGGIFYPGDTPFNGLIEDVAVLNRALSEQQIQDLYALAAGAGAPGILVQPVPQTLYPGRTAHFTVEGISGARPLTYRWQRNGVNLSDGATIFGSSTNSLTISNVAAGNVGNYRLVITNSVGAVTSSVVALTIVPPTGAPYESNVIALNPVAYWRLNETADPSVGATPVHDYYGGLAGTYGTASQNGFTGVSGPLPSEGFSAFESTNTALQAGGASSWVTVPPLNLNTATVSFTMWIHPTGSQADYAGLFMTRGASTEAGIGYGGAFSENAGQLAYTWNDNTTWTFQSGLTIPADMWSFVAVVIETNNATLYLYNDNGLLSATNPIAHVSERWAGDATIGSDEANSSRTFVGRIDEVAVFKYALSPAQVLALYGGTPPVTLSIERSGANVILRWPEGTLQQANAVTGAWSTVSGAAPPSHTSPAAGQRFFRVLVQ